MRIEIEPDGLLSGSHLAASFYDFFFLSFFLYTRARNTVGVCFCYLLSFSANRSRSRSAVLGFLSSVTSKRQQMSLSLLAFRVSVLFFLLSPIHAKLTRLLRCWEGALFFFLQQTDHAVGRVLSASTVSSFCYSDPQLTRLLRVWGRRLVLQTNRPRGGPGAVLFSSM